MKLLLILFENFELISKRVYQEVFDELEEKDDGCEDPLWFISNTNKSIQLSINNF